MTPLRPSRPVIACLAVAAALFGAPGLPPAVTVAGGAGQIIVVTTTTDAELFGDGCSLREAIKASNEGSYFECIGSDGFVDRIQFSLGGGVPVINVVSSLPAITEPVNIRGATGGATMVRLAGPGSGTGLNVEFSAAGGSIHGMQIDGFATGIHLKGATTVAGNVIGPNSGSGVFAQSGASMIGGTNTFTPTPCSNDCNVISGNGDAGVLIHAGATGIVSGNFIGVAANGVTAMPNKNGIQLNNDGWTIGGTTAGARNVISGNTDYGLWILDCAGSTNCRIQGNYIGTTASGNAPRGNGKAGILYDAGGTTIGGSEPGAGNVISGNTGPGIHFQGDFGGAGSLTILGNKIGTTPFGQPMGNSGAGVLIKPSFDDAVGAVTIGSPTVANERNVIAYNGTDGVRTNLNSGQIGPVEVRGNSIFDNGGVPFFVQEPVNFPRTGAPSITGFWPLQGMTCSLCLVDIYSDASDEGRVFEGTATANATGRWSFAGILRGPRITATETDSMHRTSRYSAAVLLPPRPDGRIKVGSGSLVGNNVYNLTGTDQTRMGSAARGKTITFSISLQNDSKPDSFKVQGAGSATHYTVKYFRNSTNITTGVVNGTYTTPNQSTGAVFVITAKVTVRSTAPAGSSVTRLVTISSANDPAIKDAVKLIAKRK